ncbi:MAG: hypothetical protein K940chlam3_01316, partial [Chlamydiae bacterium]|nr:hypothetical protein [Chlamydiota bacterium]
MKLLVTSFISALYPPLCLHCQEGLLHPDCQLCELCLSLIEFLDPHERCPRCFSLDYSIKLKKCMGCREAAHPFSGIGAAFDYVGPAATLVKKVKYGGQAFLAKTLAAYLVAQFSRLNWPMPDIVIPVPIAFDRMIQRGYNQSELISQKFASLLDCPCENHLERLFGDYSQVGLSHHQRKQLGSARFRLKRNVRIKDQTVLVIDDVTTTGKTLEQCGRALLGGYPKR